MEFDRVTVFYFPRCQGFTSVPSRGGCTLGMVSKHSSSRQFTLAEFSKEQENVRREKLEEKLKEEKLEALKWKVSGWIGGVFSHEGLFFLLVFLSPWDIDPDTFCVSKKHRLVLCLERSDAQLP